MCLLLRRLGNSVLYNAIGQIATSDHHFFNDILLQISTRIWSNFIDFCPTLNAPIELLATYSQESLYICVE